MNCTADTVIGILHWYLIAEPLTKVTLNVFLSRLEASSWGCRYFLLLFHGIQVHLGLLKVFSQRQISVLSCCFYRCLGPAPLLAILQTFIYLAWISAQKPLKRKYVHRKPSFLTLTYLALNALITTCFHHSFDTFKKYSRAWYHLHRVSLSEKLSFPFELYFAI